MSLPPGPNLAPVDQREVGPDPLPPRPATIQAAVAAMGVGAVLAVVDTWRTFAGRDRAQFERDLDAAGVEPGDLDGLFTIVRVVGVAVGLAVAGVWILHAVLAHRGRGGVRPWATILAALFVVGSLIGMTTESGIGVAYLALRLVVAGAAAGLLWAAPSTAFFTAARR